MAPLQACSHCFTPLSSGQSAAQAHSLLVPRHASTGQQQRQRTRLPVSQAHQSAVQPLASSIRSSIHSLRSRSVRCWARKSKQQQQQQDATAGQTADVPQRIMLQVAPADGENPAVYLGFDPETMELVPKYVMTEELLEGLDGVDVARPAGIAAADAAAAQTLSVPDLRVITDEEEVGLIGEGLPIINGVSEGNVVFWGGEVAGMACIAGTGEQRSRQHRQQQTSVGWKVVEDRHVETRVL